VIVSIAFASKPVAGSHTFGCNKEGCSYITSSFKELLIHFIRFSTYAPHSLAYRD